MNISADYLKKMLDNPLKAGIFINQSGGAPPCCKIRENTFIYLRRSFSAFVT